MAHELGATMQCLVCRCLMYLVAIEQHAEVRVELWQCPSCRMGEPAKGEIVDGRNS